MNLLELRGNEEFMEWLLKREKVSGDTADEESLQKFWTKYQKELEYDQKLGF
ncbi:MAG: hypothetical protein ACRDCW_01325 [Sarcina sp.]